MLQAFPSPLVSFPLVKRSLEAQPATGNNLPRPFLPSTALLAALWDGRDDKSAPNPPSTLYQPIGHPTKRKHEPWTTADTLVKRPRHVFTPPASAPLRSPDLPPSPSPRPSPPTLALPASSVPFPSASLTRTSTQQDSFAWPPVEDVGLEPEDEAVMPEQEDPEGTEEEEHMKEMDEVRVLRGALC